MYSWIVRSGTPAAARVVAKVCRRSWKRIWRTPASRARRLEAPGDLRAVQRHAELRVREDQVVVVAEHRAQPPLLELPREPVGHRHRALVLRSDLPSPECSYAHPRVADADRAGRASQRPASAARAAPTAEGPSRQPRGSPSRNTGPSASRSTTWIRDRLDHRVELGAASGTAGPDRRRPRAGASAARRRRPGSPPPSPC